MKKKRFVRNERWVVKVGSNIVCSGGPILMRAWMHQISQLKKNHRVEVIWVTSGAIASAVERTGFRKRNRLLPEKQALSAIGQPLVMDLYNLSLQASGLLGAQILLTYGDLRDKVSLTNFTHTIEKLLEWDVVPILNENDAVATEEIKFGDNDSLSAQVAHYADADRLIILTDVNGFYDADPNQSPNAKVIKRIDKVTPSLLAKATPRSGSNRGTGGMLSKLNAAKYASERGIETWMIKGDLPHGLIHVAEGNPVGTVISAQKRSHKKRSRKRLK